MDVLLKARLATLEGMVDEKGKLRQCGEESTQILVQRERQTPTRTEYPPT